MQPEIEPDSWSAKGPLACLFAILVGVGLLAGGGLLLSAGESMTAPNGAAILAHPKIGLVTGLTSMGGNLVVLDTEKRAWIDTPKGLRKGDPIFGQGSSTPRLLSPSNYESTHVYVLEGVLDRQPGPLGRLTLEAFSAPTKEEMRRCVRVFQREGGALLWKVGPLGDSRNPHEISKVAWVEGKIVAGAKDGKIDLYESSTGALLRTLRGRTPGQVSALCFDADGSRVAAGIYIEGRAQEVLVWDLATGEEQLRIELAHGATALAFSEAGSRLAIGTSQGDLRVYGPQGALEISLPHDRQGLLEREGLDAFYVEAVLFYESEVIWAVHRRTYRYDLDPPKTPLKER